MGLIVGWVEERGSTGSHRRQFKSTAQRDRVLERCTRCELDIEIVV